MKHLIVVLLVIGAMGAALPARAGSVVSFNEVMYHPASNEPGLEWVELYNPLSVNVDLSGWRIAGGIDYTFPDGSQIRAGSYLVVAIAPPTLAAQTGLTNILGPFFGKLSNTGERLDLWNLNGRLIDSVHYGVEGAWPTAPDGSGVSLAKRATNLASAAPESWVPSPQVGGSPGKANFDGAPITGATRLALPFSNQWRYDGSGVDRGTAWVAPAYDDTAWSLGSGPFHVGTPGLPVPGGTLLPQSPGVYYFRTEFDFQGDPSAFALAFRPLVDDGAVFYLNGKEISRFNLPSGTLSAATFATSPVGTPSVGEWTPLASTNLVMGRNVLAAEVHPANLTTNGGFRVTPSTGYRIAWDGGDGDFSTASSPAPVPLNDARASQGGIAFASSNPGLVAALNDGRYGTSSSWSPAAGDSSPWVAVRFPSALPITSIAWGRDNGDATDPACGGTCTDRALGLFTLQYTLAPDPTLATATSSNPATDWVTLGTLRYNTPTDGFSPHLRHRFDLASTGAVPLAATGIRIKASITNSFDEIEINPPAVSHADAAFGLELAMADILPPAPSIRLNEVGLPGGPDFSVELINIGLAPASLAGLTLVRTGTVTATSPLPSVVLGPGEMISLTPAQLGFGAIAGSKLFLYGAGGFTVLDAISVTGVRRARHPDGTGPWMTPSAPTPGASNVFNLQTDLVFNEVMYHPPPADGVRAVLSNTPLVTLSGPWRYEVSGSDLGTAWRLPGYDDSAWAVGQGVLATPGAITTPTPGTPLPPVAGTAYFRASFLLDGPITATNVSLTLRTIIDDGAILYLNGVEIVRQNLPQGPIDASTQATSPVGVPTLGTPITLPAALLTAGTNLLAVEVHQAGPPQQPTGLILKGGGLKLIGEGPVGGVVPANLARAPGATPFVIDSLAGYAIHDYLHLNDGVYGNANSWIGNSGSPGYAGIKLGGLHTVHSIAFGRDNTGQLTDRTLGTYTLQYTSVALPGTSTKVTGDPATGWATIGTLAYQGPGTGLFTYPSRRHLFTFDPVDATAVRLLVPGTGITLGTDIDEFEVDPPTGENDLVLGAELTLVATLAPASVTTFSTDEWVELYNRGTSPVDLTGWSIAGGISFLFAPGTRIEPDGYLVVSSDARGLAKTWPEVAGSIVGNFFGKIGGNDTLILRDPSGNTANRITLLASGWSDGGGSTLELIDPRADNTLPGAWADSLESTSGDWFQVRYRGQAVQAFGNTLWNEFRLALLDSGEALVDDVSVVRDPDGARQQLIQNGDFEITSGNLHWRMLGDHRHSRIETEPEHPANHVLHVVSSAPPRMNHNHIESSFLANTPLLSGEVYEVSYRARWLAGSPQLQTSAYFSKLAETWILPMPSRHGTPGRTNSRRVLNAGPGLSGLAHSPVVPRTNDTVRISVRATDPDGVAGAVLSYRVNPVATFTNIDMAAGPGGVWTGEIPPQGPGKVVQFYVTATDGLGAASMAPAAGPDSRALYQVADSQGTKLPTHELRLIQLNADRDFMLAATNVLSQELLGGTVIYDKAEAYYDVGVRLHGSAAGRARDGDDYISYTIAFPPDHLFRGVESEVNLDRSGRTPTARQQDEIYVLHMFHRAGLPCHSADLCYFIAPRTLHTGTALMQLGAYGGLYVSERFNTVGSVFNVDATYEPSSTVNGNYESLKLPYPFQDQLGTDYTDLGDDREQYRAPFDLRHGARLDDFSGVMRLCKTMALPQADFDLSIPKVLDVDEGLGVAALTLLCGIGDIYYSGGYQHNMRLFTPFDGGPAHLLPWDMDFVFWAQPTDSIFPSTYNFTKLLNNPATRRRYLGWIQELCTTTFHPDYMTPWLAHYGNVVGQPFAGQAGYIATRRAYALSQLPARVPFAITSNGGGDFLTNSPVAVLAGTAWLDVATLSVQGAPGTPTLEWTSVTNWRASLPVILGNNTVTLIAYDKGAHVVGRQTLTITTSSAAGGPDSDGDGMPDAWEAANGLNFLSDDAGLDPDGDGLTNLQEYLAGTSPYDATSSLKLLLTMDSGQPTARFLTAPGRGYALESTSSLPDSPWSLLATVSPSTTSRWIAVPVPTQGATAAVFLRLTTLPAP